VKLTTHPYLVKEWVELYLHSPNMPSWRGAQLNRDNFTFTSGWGPLALKQVLSTKFEHRTSLILSCFASHHTVTLDMSVCSAPLPDCAGPGARNRMHTLPIQMRTCLPPALGSFLWCTPLLYTHQSSCMVVACCRECVEGAWRQRNKKNK